MKRNILFLLLTLMLAACGGAPDEATAVPIATDVTIVEPTDVVDLAEPTITLDTAADGLDTDIFFDGALEAATIQNCTLSDGTETECYAITIAGYPANYDIGPFCPETTEATADDGGIWFDGDAVYDIDGAFILGLADIYADSNWKLYDDDGNVNVTDTQEAFEAAARPNVDPAYYNHCVEGRIEWLENGEPVQTTVLIPTTPIVGASATQANGSLGVTLNGVIIDGAAPVQAILSAYTIAAFDDCGGHINAVDGYHLHGARGCSEVGETVDGETPIFAYALDGHALHSPLSEADEAAAELDACQGHTTEADGYHYHAASVEENAILSCFTGLTVESAAGDNDGRRGDGSRQGGQGRGLDITAGAATLGITEDELRDALDGPPPNFDAAATTLGITVEALQAALTGGAQPAPDEETDPASTEETTELAESVDTNEEAAMSETAATTTFQFDAWSDNWFAAYLDETLLVEDSVSITTERSFNSESAAFDASYPLHLNFILKDFKENDTGLEYIGANNQQMGDGGFIMQLTDTNTGAVVAVSDSAFTCLVIHDAPLDKSCESEANPVAGATPCDFMETSEPDGWKSVDFDDSAWTATTIHSAAAVDPKQGYDDVSWDDSAEFIWGPDLETNNTLLCRVTISGQ